MQGPLKVNFLLLLPIIVLVPTPMIQPGDSAQWYPVSRP
jgi:hypothetical protein